MQEVSQAWKEAHKQMLLPETNVELSLSIADIATMNDPAQFDCSAVEEMSDLENLLGRPKLDDVPKRALLERNTWLLDGSRSVIDEKENYKAIGAVFVHEDEYGDTQRTFVRVYGHDNGEDWVGKAIPGLTIVWDSENERFPKVIQIYFRGWNSVDLATVEITDNNSVVSKIDMEVPDGWNWFDIRTDLSVYTGSWSHPDCRPRIDRIYLGQELVFDKNQILSYSHEQTGDPLSSEISTNRIEFVLDNTETNWNMLAPVGIEKYFFDQYPISVRYGMEVGGVTEWIKGGTFYLSEWRVSPDGFSSSFVAEDVFCFLRNKDYSRLGITATANKATSCYKDLNGTPGDLSTIPAGTSWLITDAAMGVTSESSKVLVPMLLVHLEPGWDEWVVASDMTVNTSTSIGSLVRSAYESSSVSASVPAAFDSFIDGVSGPYLVEETPISEVLQKCANVASCGLWQNRDGELVMQPVDTTLSDYTIPMFLAYSHPKIELTKPLKDIVLIYYSLYDNEENTSITYPVGESGETIQVDNPYLIASDSSREELCQRIVDGWKHRTIVSGEFRADPRLDLFDVVTVETKYGNISPVIVTSIKYNYNGSFRGTYVGRIIDVS